jgi:hypothetical protein
VLRVRHPKEVILDPGVGGAYLGLAHVAFQLARMQRSQRSPMVRLGVRLKRRHASDKVVSPADLEPHLHRQRRFAVAGMAGEHAQGAGREHHLALPFEKARLPERQGRRLGQVTQPVEPVDRPRQGTRRHQIAEGLWTIRPEHVIGVLDAIWPFDKVEAGSAEQLGHVGPEGSAGVVVVPAPNEAFRAL